MKLFFVRSFIDNYIWILEHHKVCVIVDPGQSEKVLNFLEKKGFFPTAILITHHHYDHTGGILNIKRKYPRVDVFAPKEVLSKEVTFFITEKINRVEFSFFSFKVFHAPGHTKGHLLYYQKPYLFCGDTFFSGGCGKIFEGTSYQMYQSILLIESLPSDTLICCAHEYTVKNLSFASTLLPKDKYINQYLDISRKKTSILLPTVPSTLSIEKKINIFLRCDDEIVKNSPKIYDIKDKKYETKKEKYKIFSRIRKMRDFF
ncbi:hydroxyacylglutathione hydrolase [Candidatus Riesia pediculicola]|uniref:Hydroxyacylglutathione hydrolase n=1 Tax=Riesia pediculicola (strain USDA) TaxID=515618 RepID=D4G822_RIEPU|nr:hydroxyacylglutathione hydrolase [Candidatus Riesia pediculicola]ADD79419.1 probable hydroxyacylglutathione hydrolase [Candidatus Riesia pediculicola USDA]QOJ86370.1 hydroxyacylglutathione hydrolase [Candidatus Riesia pediculicola]